MIGGNGSARRLFRLALAQRPLPATANSPQLPNHPKLPTVEIDIGPPQTQDFGHSKASGQHNRPERVMPIVASLLQHASSAFHASGLATSLPLSTASFNASRSTARAYATVRGESPRADNSPCDENS